MFAVIATYGLRCHELWRLIMRNPLSLPITHSILMVTKSRNQNRTQNSFPIPIEWVEKFDIANPKLMFLEKRKEFFHKNPRELANCVGERLRLKKTGFPAYHMRHRYAVRGHELGFHIDDMASGWGTR
jgi:hypothetical protein